jgi:hypothetical protein
MPTESEYSKLLEIVARAHPQVVPNFEPNRFGSQDWDRRQYLAGFVACFGRLESLWRFNGNELGRDRAEFWVDETNRMLPGTQAYVNKSHLVAACVAWGDVSFSTARWPYDVFVGLSYSTGRDVRRASATWRRVLESGQVRPPVEVGPTRMPTPQPHVSFG